MTVVPSGDGQISAGSGFFIPTPKRFSSFFTGLHEIGHIMSNHHSWDRKPQYLWEYEAFSWAFNFCRRGGIEASQRTVEYERSLIAEKVREAANGGSRIINRTVVSFMMAETARLIQT